MENDDTYAGSSEEEQPEEDEMDESPEEDPYLTEESVFSAYEDFTDGPNYYYILGS